MRPGLTLAEQLLGPCAPGQVTTGPTFQRVGVLLAAIADSCTVSGEWGLAGLYDQRVLEERRRERRDPVR